MTGSRFVGFIVSIVLSSCISYPTFAADQALIEAAKKEGAVTWYTSLIIDQIVRPEADAFQKKYGIKVDFVRGDAAELALRLENESKAGHVYADVFDGPSAAATLKKEGMVLKWLPDGAKRLPKEYYDAEGYWIAQALYVYSPGFNTELVPKGTEPHSLEDLLDPKWRGKIAWGIHPQLSAAQGFVGLVLTTMGEDKGMDYLRRFAKQNVAGLTGSARQVLDQVIAGEYSIALQIFNYHAVISAAQGAPVDWIPMQPALAAFSVMSVTQASPHPNAGKLLLDFIISSEGQQIFRDAGYIPVDPDTQPKDPRTRPDGKSFQAIYLTPEQIDQDLPKWSKVYTDVFR